MAHFHDRAMGAVLMDQLTENDKIMQAISNATESPKMPTSFFARPTVLEQLSTGILIP